MTCPNNNRSPLFPQAPVGTELRARLLVGSVSSELFTSGGFYHKDAPAGKMRFNDLAKSCSVTIDCDFCDYPVLQSMFQTEDTKEIKKSLYALSEWEVEDLMNQTGFIIAANNGLVGLGFPQKANRVIFTGHGVCLIYWLPDNVGWNNDDAEWSAVRAKGVLKRLVKQHTPWFIDPDAKDVGTRLLPVPGHPHRNSDNKTIRVMDGGHDDVADWAGIFSTWDATLKAKPGRTSTRRTGKKGQPSQEKHVWSRDLWPSTYPVMAAGDKLDSCPKCKGSGCKRPDETPVVWCHSCKTYWKIPVVDQSGFNVQIDPATGWAIWPDEITETEIWKTRTGTGKTERFKKVIADWKKDCRWSHKAVVVSPTVALAGSLATRLGLQHAKAGESVTSATCEGITTCLAGIDRTAPFPGQYKAGDVAFIMDEVEGSSQQFLEMLGGHRGLPIKNHLLNWLAFAGRVILADAHAGHAVAWLCVEADKLRAARDLPPRAWGVNRSMPHRFNVLKVTADQNVEAAHMDIIMDDIGQGHRVAVGCGSKATANAFAEKVGSDYPNKNVQVVVGSGNDDEQQDLSADRLKCDVLIYTSAMGSGVSVDVKDWYYRRHVILGRSPALDGNAFEQMMHRVRSPIEEVIVMSGGEGSVVIDDRTKPEFHKRLSKARLESGERYVGQWSTKATYRSDWNCSPDAEQFGDLQCVVEAARYSNGFRWTWEYIASRHDVTVLTHVDEAEAKAVQSEISASKTAAKWARAGDVAASTPLDDDKYMEVKNGTKKDREEELAYEATIYARAYGAAWTGANDAAKTQLAYNAKHKRALVKNRVFAQALLHTSNKDDVDALYNSSIKRNDKKTFFKHKETLRESAVIAQLLLFIGVTTDSTEITNDLARDALANVRAHLRTAGITLNTCVEDGNFIRALSDVLRRAGITLRVQRTKVNGRTVRRYYLDKTHLGHLSDLAVAQIERWRNPPDDAADTFKNKYPNGGARAFRHHFR